MNFRTKNKTKKKTKAKDNNKDREGMFRSIFTAYFILLLHVFLLAGVGVSIVLFRGVYHYLPWIMGCIGILVLSIAFIFYRRMKSSTTDIKDILLMPEFQNRNVEVRLMGGLASFKITSKEDSHLRIGYNQQPMDNDRTLIEDNVHKTERKLLELSALLDKHLISREEFERAKQDIIHG